MPKFVILCNLTEQGISNVKDGPQRVRESVSAVEAVGAKIEAWYSTMGAYDMVAVLDVPNDEMAATMLLALGAEGNTRTESLRAFTLEEFERIVAKLP